MRGKIIAKYNNVICAAFFCGLGKYPPVTAKTGRLALIPGQFRFVQRDADFGGPAIAN